MKFNLVDELQQAFSEIIASQLPWLKLGALSFEGRDDYYDFSYHGNGKLAVGIPNALSMVALGREAYSTKLENLLFALDDSMVNYLTDVTFHELGHLVNLAYEGNEDRARLFNYGYAAGLAEDLTARREGYALEIRTFSVQHYLQAQLGYSTPAMSFKGMYESTGALHSTISKRETLRIYNDMADRLSHEYVNRAIRKICQVLG